MNNQRQMLSPSKHALLAQRLQRIRQQKVKRQTIPCRPDPDVVPLSFAQERFWFLDQFEPGNPVYNRPFAVRLTGPLEVIALQRALDEIVCRHDVLRATFSTIGGQPVQSITPPARLPLPVVDFAHMPSTERESQAQQVAIEQAQQSFDLTRDVLLRATLVRLTDEEHVLILIMHHMVCDGWSAQVLRRELLLFYQAFATDSLSPLPDPPIQYADFAHWQRQYLQSEVVDTLISYWATKLADAPDALDVPIDRPRPPRQTYCGARQFVLLPATLLTSLKALSQHENVTLFMTLLAAFNVLRYRYTGQDDLVVGCPIAGRHAVETEGLIGFFINTLVLRTDLSGAPIFREVLMRVREVALEAYAHQALPFEKLVEALQPKRDLSHTPFFQVMFNLENVPEQTVRAQGLDLEEFEFDRGVVPFDLTLEMYEQSGGLACLFQYSTDLFDAATIERMAGHFQTLLESIVAAPRAPITQLPLLTEVERHQLLARRNDSQIDFPKDTCIHQCFEAQVERTPDAVAVVWGEMSLTYDALNYRANQLAHYLRQQGVGAEVLVGICVERSLEMIVGVLGILKAGGAYMPLDPVYPRERLAFMLHDGQVSVLLTQQRLVEQLPEHGAHVICLDTDWECIAKESEEALDSGATAMNLAYVMYTSASTGKAKGCMITHGSLINAYLAWEESYSLRSASRCHLQMANFSFDVFTGDLVRALCSGAKMVLCPHQLLLEPEKLYELMRREKVDSGEFVPVVMQGLVQYVQETKQSLDFMQLLVVGSDIWHMWEYIQAKRFCGSMTRLINSYGLSEATIDSTYFAGDPADYASHQLVPIGRPFANSQVYLLDSDLQPVPIGVPGELYVGGAGIARGYLKTPKLTAEQFIPHPFSVDFDRRLYKTGDLARYLSNGNIEFLGRLDHQVKIRGFRIELGEIESVLAQHPTVREAVVVARQDQPSDQRLVAYIVPYAKGEAAPGDWRRFLKRTLPAYMVPAAFVVLEALPLTPNGKVNRHALPAPDRTSVIVESVFEAPRTPVEQGLAQIWQDILGLAQIGIHDDFFTLGGHSLLATRVMSQVRVTFQVELPLRSLFEVPTIAGLAIEILYWAVQEQEAPHRVTGNNTEEIAL